MSEHGEFWRYLLLALGLMFLFARSGRATWWRTRAMRFTQQDSPQIEARLADLERLELQVAELENRLDFAERMLASRVADGPGVGVGSH